MSLQRALCLICERPTADGAVLAVQVDKEKLQTWFLNVCEYELEEEIEDKDKICYFCLWHAEFQWKFEEMMNEELVWWPRNLDHLDNAARDLRKNYFEGKLEQCFVQLEKIELPESESEDVGRPSEAKQQSRLWKCFYCKMKFKYSNQLLRHTKEKHKEAIRCENRNCATYFHSLEEKEEHNMNVHESSREPEKFKCSFCRKEFEGPKNYNAHVRRVHKDFPVKCSHIGCLSYFKTKIEMETHFDSAHKSEIGAKRFQCNDCGYRAKIKAKLKRHIIIKHVPESSVCQICGNSFSSESSLRYHIRRSHTFKVCSLCKLSVSVESFRKHHLNVKNCFRCKHKFQCSGLYQSHLKSCKKTLFKCDKCQKTFIHRYLLNNHTKRNHMMRGIQHKQLAYKCEPCQRYYKSEKTLKEHLNRIHKKANLKFCAHCSKSFYDFSALKHHLSVKHNLVVGHLPCSYCSKTFVSLKSRNKHQKEVHAKNKVRQSCYICGKSMYSSCMRQHLLLIHGEPSVRQQ